jgi:uncharacterized membrane-anchored protein
MPAFRRTLLLAFFILLTPATSSADDASHRPTQEQIHAYLQQQAAKLHPQHGKIVLEGGMISLTIPQDFGYLPPDEAEILIHNIWQNPPGTKTLGAIIPTTVDITSRQGWGIIIRYNGDGHVSDEDASTIDFDKLLGQMKESNASENRMRKERGYTAFDLVGWATKPRYDKETHKLYWALELQPEGGTQRSLNYHIRILGRQGYLVMSIVSAMEQLPMIEQNTDRILSFVDFNTTHRYADFNPSTDKMAAYGMAALIGGYALAKVGIFKGLILAVLALKKFLILGCLLVAAYFKKLFGRKK